MIRQLFFSLGVLLGLAAPLEAPEPSARIYRSGESLWANIELEGAFPEAALELARAGTEVAFMVRAEIENRGAYAEARRSLRYEERSKSWIVSSWPEGEKKRVAELPGALILASRIWALEIGSPSLLRGGAAVRISAASGILDETGGWHEAGILWGYAEPSLRFSFKSPEEVPR